MTSVANHSITLLKSHRLRWLFVICLPVFISACSPKDSLQQLSGSAMGTQWNISFLADNIPVDSAFIEQGVTRLLEEIEDSMSTYRPQSELSRFNALEPDRWITVSARLMQVLVAAQEVAERSSGAYDSTVGPLVELWGFGPAARRNTPPTAEEVAGLKSTTGYQFLQIDPAQSRVMKSAPVQVDLSAIAKGYAADVVAEWLLGNQIDRFLVEIGGEMRLSGHSPRGDNWRVAVEQPQAGVRAVATTLSVTDRAVATSGDYRNFFEYQGQRYSHTLDPRTGYPVTHGLVSVTVIAEQAMLADAWATALLVLGPDAGMGLAESEGLAAYFMVEQGDGFEVQISTAMLPFANRN